MENKYCEYCGSRIAYDAVICPKCGRQLEEIKMGTSQVIVNNIVYGGRKCNKWISLLLCLFLGLVGGHKFYEGKVGLGIMYIFTLGFFFIGPFIDLIVILFRPNPYYV